ncbi:MAG: universal stress protein [Chthonomonadaceae bacterium]|nr:universal stress protein [Chthonomonadaceae bacterium]
MIIETKEDVVRLSGALHKNQWMTIKAAANLLLQEHPQGIIIDCGHLGEVSGEGGKTFLEAMKDIEAAHSRIIVANLPENAAAVCKTIPGVRSQLPIALSVADARASLHTLNCKKSLAAMEATKTVGRILVPLIADVDLTYGASLAARIAKVNRFEVRLAYFIEVGRGLPLNAPLSEEEKAAQETLRRAIPQLQPQGITPVQEIQRVREALDGILGVLKSQQIDQLVLGAPYSVEGEESHESFYSLANALLERAPCEVIIGRQKRNESLAHR